jgi:hypothetical protein
MSNDTRWAKRINVDTQLPISLSFLSIIFLRRKFQHMLEFTAEIFKHEKTAESSTLAVSFFLLFRSFVKRAICNGCGI